MTTASETQSGSIPSVPCPFCGILCDDLQIAKSPTGLKVTKNGCAKALAGFERDVSGASPMIAGKPATLAEALHAATAIIKTAKLPLFGGLGTDVDGVRAVMALAEKAGGVVGHALSEAQYRNVRVLQSQGYFMSTLTEARNRADLFVIIASDINTLHPRFFERIVNPAETMLSSTPLKRTVVFVGRGLDTSGVARSGNAEVVTLDCALDRVPEVLAALKAELKGSPLDVAEIGGITAAQIADLAARCRSASYGLMVWAPPSLAFPNAELTVGLVSELVKEINLTSRFSCLSLGGDHGAATASSVCSWQSGFPLRVSFASGKPEYDPLRYSIPKMLATGEGDALVWIASFTPDLAVPQTSLPTVVFGTPGLKMAATPDVFIPVGTPGADHFGRLIRCDSVVTLPLRNLGRSTLPSVADLLGRIELAL